MCECVCESGTRSVCVFALEAARRRAEREAHIAAAAAVYRFDFIDDILFIYFNIEFFLT